MHHEPTTYIITNLQGVLALRFAQQGRPSNYKNHCKSYSKHDNPSDRGYATPTAAIVSRETASLHDRCSVHWPPTIAPPPPSRSLYMCRLRPTCGCLRTLAHSGANAPRSRYAAPRSPSSTSSDFSKKRMPVPMLLLSLLPMSPGQMTLILIKLREPRPVSPSKHTLTTRQMLLLPVSRLQRTLMLRRRRALFLPFPKRRSANMAARIRRYYQPFSSHTNSVSTSHRTVLSPPKGSTYARPHLSPNNEDRTTAWPV